MRSETQPSPAPGQADRGERRIRWATITAVVAVAGIAALVSYRHMRAVALEHGEDALNAAVIPLSVDGLIVAASMSMLSASRSGRKPPRLAYALLVLGSVASLAANVIHAEPQLTARIIAAWPSAALIGAYELLIRQIRDSGHPATQDVPNQVGAAEADMDGKDAGPLETPPSATTDADSGRDTSDTRQGADAADASSGGQVTAETRDPDEVRDSDVIPIHRDDRPRRRGAKRERLCALVADVPPDDPRSAYALAREFASRIGLHEGTARRYIAEIRATDRRGPLTRTSSQL
ncbi:DUF2637 domain-containing protein [Protofrankia symbiont of Coriaria ruscifolia]|uniref:DUF2637 domain-containing protein n=1 Tax=Protofrankia symbiont of Coriaria ruscifolia TaxID=1306542 RepID=UPI00104102AA|nr:DUF2637 domain-containing protein [Protofrankia symbiont of Coriaria ruscifolia]